MSVPLAHSQSLLVLEQIWADPPASDTMQRFHDFAISTFERLGIQPTYVGITDYQNKASDKLVKYLGRVHRRFQKESFREVHGFSLIANPPESDSPFWDFYASIGLLYTSGAKYLFFDFIIDEHYLPFASEEYDRIWQEMLSYGRWQYGHGYRAPSKIYPWMFMHGFACHGITTEEEDKALDQWRGATREEKLVKLRDLYPYNFLSDSHLSQEVKKGQTLRQFIKKQRDTEFVQLTDYGLHLWKILDESLQAELREYLYKQELLISGIGPPQRD